MDSRTRTLQMAADYVRQQTGGIIPEAGIVLGSGLGRLADQIQNPVVIPYKPPMTDEQLRQFKHVYPRGEDKGPDRRLG